MADYSGRDVSVSDAENVVVENPEDVVIREGAVAGDLIVNNAQDVVIETAGGVRVDDSEDVLVEGRVEGSVRIENPDGVDDRR